MSFWCNKLDWVQTTHIISQQDESFHAHKTVMSNKYLSITQPIKNHLLGSGADLLAAASTCQNEPGTRAWQGRDWERQILGERIWDTYGEKIILYCSYANSLLPFSVLLTLYNYGVTQGDYVCIWPQTHLILSIRAKQQRTDNSLMEEMEEKGSQTMSVFSSPSASWFLPLCLMLLRVCVCVCWWRGGAGPLQTPAAQRKSDPVEGVRGWVRK